MGFWQQLFGSTQNAPESSAQSVPLEDDGAFAALGTDMHSHILPGLDDGVATPEAGVALVRELYRVGYRKLIGTPHIMGDFYKNTPAGIRAALTILKEALVAAEVPMEVDCAAEYYLDEWFLPRLQRQDEILSFGGSARYVLLETSYINESRLLNEAIFSLCAAGYQPVIAHPERYKYLHSKPDEAARWRGNGALLQVNLNSLAGYYGPAERQVAEYLIDKRLVDFAGTDAHGLKHTAVLARRVATAPYLRKLLALPLRNAGLAA